MIYRPRAHLRMFVPLPDQEEPVVLDVTPSRSRLELNDHNQADKLSCEVDWVDSGVDPRWIAGATAEFYMGTANAVGEWSPDQNNLRFVGRMSKPSRNCSGDKLGVALEFEDYTSFLLAAKPLASAAWPRYSDTLAEAWARLCEEVPGAAALADNIELRGLDTAPLIGTAVAERFRKMGHVPANPNADAWAIWQQSAGMCGLISFFDLDKCIVTTATDLYTAGDEPVFEWGLNVAEFSEARNNTRMQKGVGVTSYDPLTGRTLEAIYDPLLGKRKAKKALAKKRRGKPKVEEIKEVDFFQYPGITDESRLMELAQRVWEERSRQELEGTVGTADMTASTASGAEFDLLSLRAGDTIQVRFLGTRDAVFIKSFDSKAERVSYLVERGYPATLGQVVATQVDSLTSRSSLFYVKGLTAELSSDRDSGSFKLSIDYMNKIDPKI